MELPKRYLTNLSNIYYMDEFHDISKVTSLAKGIGDSLELLGKDESRYVIEHSYSALFQDLNKEVAIGEGKWKECVVDGMGDFHRALQDEVLLDKDKQKENNFER